LQGIGFDVRRNGVTALLGRNGAGKTTTVKAILGLVPRTGTIELARQDLTRLATHAVVRRGVGYAPEDREIFSGLSVSDNLRLAERAGSEHEYGRVFELFPELRSRARQAAGTLSGGQQQMLAIARILLNDNQLLLVDEPTKGLAPKLVADVADVLDRVAAQTTVLLVEQNLAVVRRLADHAVVVEQGRTAWAGPAAELLDDEDRTRALLGVS